ncbi:type II toxin-antitoxin system VapB family antitoxin [Lapillicoccus sp.]|uniref:type II toxin-antitoxin system VapB family antitoxin n=1 Tax=Lapillicoccus sp. TaxID=1909287 RepID=UPI0039832C66
MTIDDDLLATAKTMAARSHRTVGSVLEEALRELIARREAARAGHVRVDLPVSGRRGDPPLVDILDKEALADALADNDLR